MTDSKKPEIGTIGWVDLTVENGGEIRDFYKAIVGWETDAVSMGDYDDYCMVTPDTRHGVAGVCHARGANADLPAQWLIYITVADIEKSAAKCVELGGKILAGPKNMGGHGTYCVVQDPAGAVSALFAPK